MGPPCPETRGHPHSAPSPSKRVFSMPPPRKAPLNTPSTPALEDFPQNDDEKERLQRRRSRALDLQFSTDSPRLLASPSSRSVDLSATIPKFTNTQITEHYSTCIKLSTENKITTKNAFGLHLIDFMSEILKQKDTELTNFKVAAGTLDASTKIYAVRVDAVHADVYRVLGGLGKDAPAPEVEESHSADGSAADPETTKKAPKPRKKHSHRTIEQNVSALNVCEADQKCERPCSSVRKTVRSALPWPASSSLNGTVKPIMREEMIPLGDGDIRTMCPLLSMKPGEYSYFSPRTMSLWAGPEHWRFRPRHKQDATSKSDNRKKSTKKEFEIDFDDNIDFDDYFRKVKTTTILAKSTLENQNWRATTLPTDFHYETDDLVRLHLKPGTRLLRSARGQREETEHYEEIGDYDYNNPNDTSNFCPGLQAADSDYEESDDLFVGPVGTSELSAFPCGSPKATQENNVIPDVQGPDITSYKESDLVVEPQKVNRMEIHYAKTAKKMDMKKLKQSMWRLLTELTPATAEANHSETGNEGAPVEVADDKALSGLTRDLQRSLPPTMAQNLSVPLAFACLLHLANEKNLKLHGTKDLSDVLVMQGD
ncbi:PREDICTED: condensin complex subunit 2 isoform X2 [Hipposideros armiger]|uniref:Condensin complex subunit 2 n=1 Tax=Hipposideros armiger TaxID=186990 RepID=A0A8B7SS28_HIPAR|nr:PREDICTED: condensin complex subunit 2 isoform X2 [Hipposideros armiger]